MDRVQDIADSRGVVLVEDCAHACASQYKGRALGSFGEFTLYSFSKFAFCFVLGGVTGRDAGFSPYVEPIIERAPLLARWGINGFKAIYEANGRFDRPKATRLMQCGMAMAYSLYGLQTAPGPSAVGLWLSKKTRELQARKDNYALLRQEADRWGLCDDLETTGVVPYAVPLAVNGDKAPTLVARLRDCGIEAGLRRFDQARCVFEPNWRSCVLVPIHSDMVGRGMEQLLFTLRKTL
jgi:hypothetical protein